MGGNIISKSKHQIIESREKAGNLRESINSLLSAHAGRNICDEDKKDFSELISFIEKTGKSPLEIIVEMLSKLNKKDKERFSTLGSKDSNDLKTFSEELEKMRITLKTFRYQNEGNIINLFNRRDYTAAGSKFAPSEILLHTSDMLIDIGRILKDLETYHPDMFDERNGTSNKMRGFLGTYGSASKEVKQKIAIVHQSIGFIFRFADEVQHNAIKLNGVLKSVENSMAR